jgi:hypothetical protein
MSPAGTQTILAVVAGIICLFTAGALGRRRQLSLRYAAGWSLLGLSSIIFGCLTPLLDEIASGLNLSPAGLVVIVSSTLVLAILFMVSVSVVRLQRDVQDLVEMVALLKTKVDEESKS